MLPHVEELAECLVNLFYRPFLPGNSGLHAASEYLPLEAIRLASDDWVVKCWLEAKSQEWLATFLVHLGEEGWKLIISLGDSSADTTLVLKHEMPRSGGISA
jgi:hypothetical protein